MWAFRARVYRPQACGGYIVELALGACSDLDSCRFDNTVIRGWSYLNFDRERMSKQLDIFGNEVNPSDLAKREKQRRRKYRTMQEIYGIKAGLTCKTCKYAVRHRQAKTWYKCELRLQSHSEATDIRLKDTACNKYVWEGADNEQVSQ